MSTPSRKERLAGLTGLAFNTQSPELQNLIAFHLRDAVAKDPLEKIRLTCEAYYMALGGEEGSKILSQDEAALLDRIYLVCLSLRAARAESQFISIPWAFPQEQLYYVTMIAPWFEAYVPKVPGYTAANMISFRYSNDAKRAEKESRLVGKPAWYAFFCKTTELDLSPTSLLQLQTAFVAWAMKFLMVLYGKLGMMFAKSIQWKADGEGEDAE
jgi:hypothetical protein